MLLRKLGKTLLGKSTPFHLIVSCVTGALLAFAAPFGQAPAYWLVLVALICVLPVNLFLATLVGALCYPLGLALLPASFHVGRALLEGPTEPLFASLVNAPFTALMGFEYYAHTGGLLLALLLGLAAGLGITRLVKAIRAGFRNADRDSEAFRRWASKWWVGLLCWVLLGARPKAASYEKLEARRVGLPVRPAGIAVALVLVGASWWAVYQFSGPMLTRSLQAGLEEWNGATVDLGSAEIALGEGRVEIGGLALADRARLDTDLLRTVELKADVGVGDLLRRRFRVDSLVLRQASSGARRETPGVLTGDEPRPRTVPKKEDEKTVDDYLKDAEGWRERLAQVRRWLDRLSGDPEEEEAPEREEQETREERLDRRVRQLGWDRVVADHLIRGAPRLTIDELRIEGLEAMQAGGKPFDVTGANLSTHPRLLDATPRLSIRARDGSFAFDLDLAGSSRGGGTSTIGLVWKGIPADAIGQRLRTGDGKAPLAGGTIDLATKGRWRAKGADGVDLPFDVTLRDTTLRIGGRAEKVAKLELPLRVYGPLEDPRVLFREQDLKDALVAAGKARLSRELDERLPDDIKKKAGGLLDKLR